MSVNLDILNLTLGIIGTIAGIVSLSVHLWRLKRENPRLMLKIIKCYHEIDEARILSFYSEIEIRNLGDRGTNILEIEIAIKSNDNNFSVKMKNQDNEEEKVSMKWIRPHETIRTNQFGFIKFDQRARKEIDCQFIIYHTHGAEKIRAISKLNNYEFA